MGGGVEGWRKGEVLERECQGVEERVLTKRRVKKSNSIVYKGTMGARVKWRVSGESRSV